MKKFTILLILVYLISCSPKENQDPCAYYDILLDPSDTLCVKFNTQDTTLYSIGQNINITVHVSSFDTYRIHRGDGIIGKGERINRKVAGMVTITGKVVKRGITN